MNYITSMKMVMEIFRLGCIKIHIQQSGEVYMFPTALLVQIVGMSYT